MTGAHRLSSGGRIDRSKTISFTFDGKRLAGHPGDTLASALLANGITLVGRSFKYHRPRGIYSAGPEEPNALVTVRHADGIAEPNIRATTLELYDGLVVDSQNRWPSLSLDLLQINQLMSPFFVAGFYYKTFMWPPKAWMSYERLIRKAAGLGAMSRKPDPDRYEKRHGFCDVLIVGGGAAGLSAALAAGRAGQRVIIAEQAFAFGGALLVEADPVAWLAETLAELARMPNVTLLPRTTVFGAYDHGVFAAVERVSDHLSAAERPAFAPRQRTHVIRAGRTILATGAIERPFVFANNDRPGVMLASAVRSYVNGQGVAPGSRAVLFANNDPAYQTALDLLAAGVTVAAVVDPRPAPDGPLNAAVRAKGVPVRQGQAVVAAKGRVRLASVQVAAIDPSGDRITGAIEHIPCDLLAVSGGWDPVVHLHTQTGVRARFDPAREIFRGGESRNGELLIGAAAGHFTFADCVADGAAAGAGLDLPPFNPDQPAMPALWRVPKPPGGGKRFVDIQDDVTAEDVAMAAREGYVSVEHLKRYTTLGMGTDQGKTSNVNGIALLAAAEGKPIAEVGTTTFRPPYTPVALGALAGREIGLEYEPIRRTPMHDWHLAHGAHMIETGLWMRPQAYLRPGESLMDAFVREARGVRDRVGIVDISTLGKISVQGLDAAQFLDRVYINGWSGLKVGMARYGVMLREDGMVFDDGTTARLDEHHFHMTTTSANAVAVMAHLEHHLQVIWPELRVQVTSTTDRWAAMALAGPKSRELLARLAERPDDVSDSALPFMAARDITLAGVAARVFRISFSGELAYEINVRADLGAHLWEAFIEAGGVFDILPYGLDAMNGLRLEKGHVSGGELDGQRTADDLGLGRMMSKTKDFIGRRMAARPALVDPARPKLVGLIALDGSTRLRAGAQLVETANMAPGTTVLGHVSSASPSPILGADIALGFLADGRARHGQIIHAAFPLRNECPAVRVVDPVFFDPQGSRLRG